MATTTVTAATLGAVCSLGAVCLFVVDRAEAAEPSTSAGLGELVTAHLDWEPAAALKGCATRDAVIADVQQLLGRSALVQRSQADLTVTVRIEDRDPGWVARLQLLSAGGEARGERELLSDEQSCHALDGPIALVMALMLEARRLRSTVHLPPPPLPEEKDEEVWQGQAHAGLAVSGGLLPGLALGAHLSAGLAPPGFVPIHLGVTIWPAVEHTSDGRGGSFSAWHAGLEICPDFASSSRGAVGICGGVEGGVLTGTGIGLDYAHTLARASVQLGAGLTGSLTIAGPLSVHLQAGAAVPLHRPRFVYTGSSGAVQEVHRPWPVVPTGTLSLGFDVPPE
ncbi:MAG: hypothetical protein DRI90_06390 [Deltaproteobacteria bacterium]|nr:MAG: hypothetical protein DRI90_06390 [Deltaproteobacteria bacterium]